MTSAIRSSILEALYYGLTRRHRLEGRYRSERGEYGNWDRSYVVRPPRYVLPDSEQAICAAIAEADTVGVVGAGHSFNALHLERQTLLSLDHYKGLLSLDSQGLARFAAGTRLREATALLRQRGWALPVLPDHNAQSIAGVLATDVHGSGSPAHISEAVKQLKLVDAHGRVHTTAPGELLFRATIGGMGCTGVISEASFQCVPAFKLDTRAFRLPWHEMLAQLDALIDGNDHLAIGYLPALNAAIVEVKNRSNAALSRFGRQRETVRHVSEAILQSIALPLTTSESALWRSIGREALALPSGALKRRANLVLDSAEGYNRNVYHVQKQVEFSVPRAQAKTVFQLGDLWLRERPRQHYYLLGLRPSKRHGETLIGPAAGPAGESIVWMAPHLFGNETDQGDERGWREIIKQVDGLPHYGKNMVGLDTEYLAMLHGERWTQYLAEVRRMDPAGKFANSLIRAPRSKGVTQLVSTEQPPGEAA